MVQLLGSLFPIILSVVFFSLGHARAAEAQQTPCLKIDQEMAIAGVRLGYSTEQIIRVLGIPSKKTSGRGEDDGGAYEAETFIYPELEVTVVRGKVDNVATKSARVGTPSGIRPGASLAQIRKILGVNPANVSIWPGYIGVYYCPSIDEQALLFKMGNDKLVEGVKLVTYRP